MQFLRWATITSATLVIALSLIAGVHAQISSGAAYQIERNAQRLDRLTDDFHGLERDMAGRVAALESRMSHVESELSKLVDRMWVLIVGVCAQMFHIIWGFVDRRRKG